MKLTVECQPEYSQIYFEIIKRIESWIYAFHKVGSIYKPKVELNVDCRSKFKC